MVSLIHWIFFNAYVVYNEGKGPPLIAIYETFMRELSGFPTAEIPHTRRIGVPGPT